MPRRRIERAAEVQAPPQVLVSEVQEATSAPSYSSQLAGKIGYLAQKAKALFTFEPSKDVDGLIQLFSDVGEATGSILLGTEAQAKGLKKYHLKHTETSLYDLRKIVAEISTESKKLLNLDKLGSDDEIIFQDLIKAIDQEIRATEDAIKISGLPKDASTSVYADAKTGQVRLRISRILSLHFEKASSTLRHIKNTRPGYLKLSYWTPEAEPHFEKMLSQLHATQKAILNNPQDPSKFLVEYEKLKRSLDTSVFLENVLFKEKNKEAQAILHETLNLFDAYKNLPAPLQVDQRFSPSVRDLHETIYALTKLIEAHATLSSKAKEFLKGIYQNFRKQTSEGLFGSKDETREYHSLEVLNAALTYFQSEGARAPLGGTKTLIDELIQDCSRSVEGFDKALAKHIRKADRTKNIAALQKALHRTLVDLAKREHPEVKISSKASFETLARLVLHEPLPSHDAENQEAPNPTVLSSFAEQAIAFLSRSTGVLKEASISFIGTGFLHILKHPTFQKWIQRQDKDSQVSLKRFLEKTEEALNVAIKSKKASDLMAFFQDFLKDYSSFQFSIDGFELPDLSSESTESISAVSSSQETLLGMIKSMAQLDHEVSEEKDYEKETNKQSELLSQNCAHFITYNFISKYFLKHQSTASKNSVEAEEQVFFDIITRIRLSPEGQDPNELFISEMRSLINRNHTHISRPVQWVLKYLIPLIHKWSKYHIKSFADKFLHHIRHELENVDESSTKSDENRNKIIHRINHGIGTYQTMLKKWSEKGGDKKTVLENLSHDKEFNENMTDLELMNEVVNASIDRFLSGVDTTESISRAGLSLRSFITRPTIAPRGLVHKLFNGISSIIKTAVVGVPGSVVLGIGYVFTLFLKLGLNIAIRSTLKQSLTKSNFLNTIIEGTKNSIYEQNPYVNVITETLADQLEHLSKALDGLEEDSNDGEKSENIEIADQTKRSLQATFENLIELLNKNRFLTSDKLSQYLKKKGRVDQTLETLDDLVMPGVIDAIIEASVIASRSLLKKNLLEKQIFTLLEKTNQVITTNPQVTPEDRKKLKQKYINDENRLKMYLDKILKQIIKQATESKLSTFGKRQQLEAEGIREWIQKTLFKEKIHDGHSLITHWKSELRDLYENQGTLDPKEMLKKLDVIKHESSAFMHELTNRQASLQDSSLSSKLRDKLTQEIAPIIEQFQVFVKDDKFIKLYHNAELQSIITSDLPIIERVRKSQEVIYEQLNHIKTLDPKGDIKAIEASLSIIKLNTDLGDEGRAMIEDDKIRSREDQEELQEISSLLHSRDYKVFKEQQPVILQISQDIHGLEEIEQAFAELSEAKANMIEDAALLSHRILTTLHLRDNPQFKAINKSLHVMIQNIHHPELREQLQEYLLQLNQIREIGPITALMDEIQEFVEAAQQDHLESLTQILDEASAFSFNLSEKTLYLSTKWSEERETAIDENKHIIQDGDGNLLTVLSTLRAAAKHLKPVKLVQLQSGIIDSVKHVSERAVYALLKPKTDEALALIKDGSFAIHLAKQALLIPFVQQKK